MEGGGLTSRKIGSLITKDGKCYIVFKKHNHPPCAQKLPLQKQHGPPNETLNVNSMKTGSAVDSVNVKSTLHTWFMDNSRFHVPTVSTPAPFKTQISTIGELTESKTGTNVPPNVFNLEQAICGLNGGMDNSEIGLNVSQSSRKSNLQLSTTVLARSNSQTISATDVRPSDSNVMVSANNVLEDSSGIMSDSNVEFSIKKKIIANSSSSGVSDSNPVISNSNMMTDIHVVIEQSSLVHPDHSPVISESSIVILDSSIAMSDSNVVIPDSDNLSQLSVDIVNCDSLEIASSCSIPDMSEYLPCEETIALQNEVDIQSESSDSNVDFKNNANAHFKNNANAHDVSSKDKGLTPVETQVNFESHTSVVTNIATVNSGSVWETSVPKTSYNMGKSENKALHRAGALELSMEDAKIVTSDGKQYIQWHTPAEHVNVVMPVSGTQFAGSGNGVQEFISMAMDMSTGSNVEVGTAACHSSIKKAARREKDRIYKRTIRLNPEYRAIHRTRTREKMQQNRSDNNYRNAERERDRIRRAKARKENKSLREREKTRDREYRYYRKMQQNVGGPVHVLPVINIQEEVICTIPNDVEHTGD